MEFGYSLPQLRDFMMRQGPINQRSMEFMPQIGQAQNQAAQSIIDGVLSGRLNRDEFISLSHQFNQVAYLQGQLSAGGYTPEDGEQLRARLQGLQANTSTYLERDEHPQLQLAENDPLRARADEAGRIFDNFSTDRQRLAGAFNQNLTGSVLQANRERPEPLGPGERGTYRLQTGAPIAARLQQGQQGQAGPQAQPPAAGPAAGGAPAPAGPNADFLRDARAGFNGWDADGNGRLSRAELDTAMRNPEVRGNNALALANLRRSYGQLTGLNDDGEGISVTDLDVYGRGGENPAIGSISGEYATMRTRGTGSSRLIEGERPDPQQIRQGSLGTCNLLSVIGGLSSAEIQRMITQRPDGQYTVRFADGREFTVPQPTEAERAYHSGANGHWPAVLEQAYGQRLAADNPGADPRSSLDGLSVEDALRAFTGRDARRVQFTEVGMGDALRATREALTHGPVVAGTMPVGVEQALHPGVVPGHSYSLVGIDDQGMVTLRNPWGQGEPWGALDGRDDGTFQMPFDQFYTNFGGLAYAPRPS